MAKTKNYQAKKLGYSIHRPPSMIPLMHDGHVVYERKGHAPIEFVGGRLSTSDKDLQDYLEDYPGFNKDYILLNTLVETAAKVEAEAAGQAPRISSSPAQKDAGDEDEVEIIGGVTNKNKAIAALVERGVDSSEFTPRTNKAAVKQIAAEYGFSFDNW